MAVSILFQSLLVVGAISQAAAAYDSRRLPEEKLPNVVVFVVDDLGWNQVGYHASAAGNEEIQTPNIDAHVVVELDRAYMSTAAAVQTGRTNALNRNLTVSVDQFQSEINFVGGLQPGTRTIAEAFAEYGEATIGEAYQTIYTGKWNVGGTAWSNTPMGMGYDSFLGFWGDEIDSCDGYVPYKHAVPRDDPILPFRDRNGPSPLTTLPGYWVQNAYLGPNPFCEDFEAISFLRLSSREKEIACRSHPRNPPKLIDDDLIQQFRYQIYQHDEEGDIPFFHYVSLPTMTRPHVYPAKYNTEIQAERPAYFRENRPKPVATNEDARLATAHLVKYVDDLFGSCMEALKSKPGLWENTIVLFTSGTGGAIDGGSAINNNYPLRGAKQSPWEGGMRVAQFLSGGWVEAHLPDGHDRVSNTFLFAQDVGPTLLEMAGATDDYLLDDKVGPVYGRRLWEYIRDSVDPAKGPETHQLVRKASMSSTLFFDVHGGWTYKSIVTGTTPQLLPRFYSPIWPTNEDLLTDASYLSVQPCRPGGVPHDCCYFDITNDPTESNPMPTDCAAMTTQAKVLFDLDTICRIRLLPWPPPILQDHMCLVENDIRPASPNSFSLWSQFRSAGPLTNMAGSPVDDLPMKCICPSLAANTTQDEVDGFLLTVLTQPICVNSAKLPESQLGRFVPCDGSFTYNTQGAMMQAYATQGVNVTLLEALQVAEYEQDLPAAAAYYTRTLLSYANRADAREWPHLDKFPNIVGQMDTCTYKGGLVVPVPVSSVTPFYISTRQQQDSTQPFRVHLDGTPSEGDFLKTVGLCFPYTANQYFCPSVHNANLTHVVSWDFNDVSGTFADGRLWAPMTAEECLAQCGVAPNHTAYIGSGPWGLAVD